MIRYTTPLLPLEVEDIDLTQNQDVYVSMKQDAVYMEKRGEDLTITYDGESNISTISYGLTQAESAKFDFGAAVEVQVNFINEAGIRDATNIARIPVMRNLLNREIKYGD